MKVAPIQTNPNKMINRKFQALRKSRNTFWALAGVNLAFAASDAIAHKGFMTIFMGSAGLFSLKCAETTINEMLKLKPQYKEFIKRAKNINRIRMMDETV